MTVTAVFRLGQSGQQLHAQPLVCNEGYRSAMWLHTYRYNKGAVTCSAFHLKADSVFVRPWLRSTIGCDCSNAITDSLMP